MRNGIERTSAQTRQRFRSLPGHEEHLESQINADHPKAPLPEVFTDLSRPTSEVENGFPSGGPLDDQIENRSIYYELQQVICESLCVVFCGDIVCRTYRRHIKRFHHRKSCFLWPKRQWFR